MTSPARAEIPTATWAWAAAGMEVSGAVYGGLRFGAKVIRNEGTVSMIGNLAPAAIGLGAGIAAYHWDLDARPALAAHGVVWGGFSMLLIGAAIEGRHERAGLRIHRTAWVVSGLGAIAGGVLGATAGNRAPEAWLVGPTAGAACGLIIGGVAVMASGDIGGDRTARRLILGTAGGMAAGMIGATIYGFTRPRTAPTSSSLVPSISPGPRRFMVTIGGAF